MLEGHDDRDEPVLTIFCCCSLFSIGSVTLIWFLRLSTISIRIQVVGLVQMTLGFSGVMIPLLRYISPVTVATGFSAVGLGLYALGFANVASCFPMGLTMMVLTIGLSKGTSRGRTSTGRQAPLEMTTTSSNNSRHGHPSQQKKKQKKRKASKSIRSSSMSPQETFQRAQPSKPGTNQTMKGTNAISNDDTTAHAAASSTRPSTMDSVWNMIALVPILTAMGLTWSLSGLLTAASVWEPGHACRTDSARQLWSEAPLFRIPYPGQWKGFRFESYGTYVSRNHANGSDMRQLSDFCSSFCECLPLDCLSWIAIVPMLGGMIASMIESVGDYYSCAKLSGAPPPPPPIICRGLAMEGMGAIVAGLLGSGSGTTSYSENVGAIALTRVGSRVVVQMAAATMIVLGLWGKVTALLAALPTGIVGGMYCVVFAVILATGLSNLQYVSLTDAAPIQGNNAPRNLFIIGFALFNALSIAGPGGYFSHELLPPETELTMGEEPVLSNHNPFGDSHGGRIAYSICSSPMIMALLIALVLDNLIPGTRQERGLDSWNQVDSQHSSNLLLRRQYQQAYGLPRVVLGLMGRSVGVVGVGSSVPGVSSSSSAALSSSALSSSSATTREEDCLESPSTLLPSHKHGWYDPEGQPA